MHDSYHYPPYGKCTIKPQIETLLTFTALQCGKSTASELRLLWDAESLAITGYLRWYGVVESVAT